MVYSTKILLVFKGVSKRSAFVISSEGKITFSWSSEDPKQLPRLCRNKKPSINLWSVFSLGIYHIGEVNYREFI